MLLGSKKSWIVLSLAIAFLAFQVPERIQAQGDIASQLQFIKDQTACRSDIAQFCAGMKAGSGRLYNCLDRNKARLTESCIKALPRAEKLLRQAGVIGGAMAADALPVGRKPVAIIDGKYPASYFPNTELLGKAEMRITALGTGMPNQTRAAVSISYLVELGNGDKFIFDAGSGMMANLFSLRPDFSKLDKVFASHLHIDHVGDFMGLHIAGWLSGRYDPIHIYGPSGPKPELGTKAFVEGMQKAYAWDLQTRSGALPDKGAKIVVHEFDYKQENKVVYEKNGVTVRSWPAIHSLDGSVSYSLEWNGLKYVFGGDTYPNKWYIKYATNADIASHEAFLPPKALARYFGWDMAQATYVSTRIHTEPQAFGKVMSAVKPRLAVGYHSVQSPENNAAIMDGVRKTYDGPLELARDLMVINVTKKKIITRMATVDEYVLPPDVTEAYKKAPRSDDKSPSDFIESGKWKGYTPPPMPKKQ